MGAPLAPGSSARSGLQCRTGMVRFITMLRQLLLLTFLLAACQSSGRDETLDVLHDADGNTYRTIALGEQTWMAEDLRVKSTTDDKPLVDGSKDSAGTTEPRFYSEHRASRGEVVLYNWAAAQRIAPRGWHLPSAAEWQQLADFLSEDGKSAGTMLLGNDSESGFDAQLSGAWFKGRFLPNQTLRTNYWSSTFIPGKSVPHAVCPNLEATGRFLPSNGANVEAGWSVRCIKDS